MKMWHITKYFIINSISPVKRGYFDLHRVIHSFSAKPKIIDLRKGKHSLVAQTRNASNPGSGAQLSQIFSACTVLNLASSNTDCVFLLQQHPLHTMGKIPDFVKTCWPKYCNVHGFPVVKKKKKKIKEKEKKEVGRLNFLVPRFSSSICHTARVFGMPKYIDLNSVRYRPRVLIGLFAIKV